MAVSSRFRRSGVTAIAVLAAVAMLITTSEDRSPAGAERPISEDPTLPAPGENRLIVRFTPGSSANERAAAVQSSGLRQVGEIPALSLSVVEAADRGAAAAGLGRLNSHHHVEFAEPDATMEGSLTPTDPQWSQQWGNTLASAPEVWNTTTGSSDVVIAVLDSGYLPELADVAGQFVSGWDFVNSDSNPIDDAGHGTRVTGIMAARIGNGTGLAGWCPGCRYMPVKVLGSSATGSYSAFIAGLTWAADHGADVINMSLGGWSDSQALRDAVAYARARGAVVVAAAGNDQCDCPRYPAAIPDVVSVGASDQLDAPYSYSNFGSWIDVSAPGSNITTWTDGNFWMVGGTSSASPVVAGIAGLLRSAHPEATVAEIEHALQTGVVPNGGWVRHGRIDAALALAALEGGGGSGPTTTVAPTTTTTTTAPTTTVPPSTTTTTIGPTTTTTAPPAKMTTTYGGVATKKKASHTIVTAAGQLSVHLTASTSASFSLELVDPDGRVVARTKGPAPFAVSSVVTAGSYTARVSGSGVYSLTVTRPVP